MTKKRKIFYLFCIVIVVSCIGYTLISILGGFAQSYSNSQSYIFNVGSKDLIAKVKQLKDQNPQFKVMTTLENRTKEELPDKYNESHFSCYFYLPTQKITVFCVIHDRYPALLQLISISRYANFASWQDINTDQLSKKENDEIKLLFEKDILDRLGQWN